MELDCWRNLCVKSLSIFEVESNKSLILEIRHLQNLVSPSTNQQIEPMLEDIKLIASEVENEHWIYL